MTGVRRAEDVPAEGADDRHRDRPRHARCVHRVGAALIENFSWIFYIFGALLLFLAYKQAFSHGDSDPANGKFMRFVRRILPVSEEEYNEDKLTVRKSGKTFVTRCCW